jgi:hypothetical protein
MGDCDPVHGRAIERRLIALGAYGFREHPAAASVEPNGLGRPARHACPDQRLGIGYFGHALYSIAAVL